MSAPKGRPLIEILNEKAANQDRRSITSRANLGDHIPQALDPNGTTTIATRIPTHTLKRLDQARGNRTRSEWLRATIEAALM